jgi:hypothetical protein
MSVVFSCCWASALDSQQTCIVVVSLHVCYRQLIPIGSFVRLRFGNQISLPRLPSVMRQEEKHADAKENRSDAKQIDQFAECCMPAVCFHSGCGARNTPGIWVLCVFKPPSQARCWVAGKVKMEMHCDRLMQLVHGRRGSGMEATNLLKKLMYPILCSGGSHMSARDSWTKCRGFWLGCCRCRSIFLGP